MRCRHSMSGTPALTKNDMRLAKKVCSLVEKRVNDKDENGDKRIVNTLFMNDTEHLFNAGVSGTSFCKPVLKKCRHTALPGKTAKFGSGCFAHNSLTYDCISH